MTALRLPQLTEQQARALIGTIGLIVAVALATFTFGRDAAVAVIGLDVIWLLWNRADMLERLHNLEVLVLGMLPEEVEEEAVGGWPEEEPNPVEPPEEFDLTTFTIQLPPNPTRRVIATVPIEEPATDEFPAVTEPMALGDEIEADFRAHEVRAKEGLGRMVERQVGDFKFRVWEEAS